MNENQQGVQLIESEEDKKKKAGQSQPGSAFAGGTTSPTGAKPSPTGPVAPSGTQQARAVQEAGPTRGTGFTGVGRYLQANVGSRLGEQVAGRVAQTGQQAQTRLGQAVGQFGQQIGQQRQQLTAQQRAAQSALQRIAGTPVEAPAETAQAVQLAPSQEEVAAYQAVAGGQFQAPSGLQDIGDIRSQAQLAGQLAAGTRDTAGRLGLLRQVVGRGPQQYTKGQSALDALILGQAGGQLAAARRASAGLERKVGTEEALAAERARQFGAEAQRAKAALTGEAAGIEKRTASDIGSQKEAYEKGLENLYNTLQTEISKGEVSKKSADLLKSLGLDVETVGTYGLDLNQLKNLLERKDAGEITTASSAKTEQLQRLNALRQIAGQAPVFSEEELKKAGTTSDPVTGLSYKKEGFETLQKAQQDAIQKAVREFTSTLPLPQMGENWYAESESAPSAFQYSPGRGQILSNVDLARRLNELYDPKTGQVNTELAKELINFWSGRRQYLGKEGLFGAGRYGEFAGDAARIAALQNLIAETGKKIKIKEE